MAETENKNDKAKKANDLLSQDQQMINSGNEVGAIALAQRLEQNKEPGVSQTARVMEDEARQKEETQRRKEQQKVEEGVVKASNEGLKSGTKQAKGDLAVLGLGGVKQDNILKGLRSGGAKNVESADRRELDNLKTPKASEKNGMPGPVKKNETASLPPHGGRH